MVRDSVAQDVLFTDDEVNSLFIETHPYDQALVEKMYSFGYMLGEMGEEFVAADSLPENDLRLEAYFPPVPEDAFFDVDHIVGAADNPLPPADDTLFDIAAIFADPAADRIDLDLIYDSVRAGDGHSAADLAFATSLLPPFPDAAPDSAPAEMSIALGGGDYPAPDTSLDFIFKNLAAGDES